MDINLLVLAKATVSIMFLLYWYLLFELIDQILEGKDLKKIYRVPIGAINILAMMVCHYLFANSMLTYLSMLLIIIVEFHLIYKDKFVRNLFCASACIIHVLAIRSVVAGGISIYTGYSVYEISHMEIWLNVSIAITFFLLDMAIVGVMHFIPLDYVRIINQHKEQQWFLIAWMTINNLYLFLNMEIWSQMKVPGDLTLNEIFAPIVILVGLYIVLFFAIKTSILLGYKEKNVELKYKAERDSLTGLYNKEITGKLINEHLTFAHGRINSALFIIDVDNFKVINDHFGHVYGDAVLCELGDKLQNMFRNDDVVGRIGGDEYIAYMKNGASEESLKEKAEEICKAFHIEYKVQEKEKYNISASVGISRYPKDGRKFQDLYKNADIALYQSKGNGKNRYSIYDGSDFVGYKSSRTEIQATGERINIELKNYNIAEKEGEQYGYGENK